MLCSSDPSSCHRLAKAASRAQAGAARNSGSSSAGWRPARIAARDRCTRTMTSTRDVECESRHSK